MKRILLTTLCALVAAALCACGAQGKTMEDILPVEETEAALRQQFQQEGLDETMDIRLDVDGNTVIYDYLLKAEATAEDLTDEAVQAFEAAFDDGLATMEQMFDAMSAQVRGLGKVKLKFNLYNSNDELIYAGDRETKEY